MILNIQVGSPEAGGHLCAEGTVPEDVLYVYPRVRSQRGSVRRTVPQKPFVRHSRPSV